jgi:5-(carboxyamino)imidazole ribonucleotide synthase
MKLGIIGGGQLARMMVPPAHRLGIEVWVLENSEQSPAGLAGAIHVAGDWRDPDTCRAFAEKVDVVTLDHEFAPIEALEAVGDQLFPGTSTMACIADKLEQKRYLERAGLLVVESHEFESAEELKRLGEELGYPLMIKTRAGGYDGKGNYSLAGPEQIDTVFEELKGALYAERFLDFDRELAVMVARDRQGNTLTYPVVETIQENHICVAVQFPARLPKEESDDILRKVDEIGRKAAEAVNSIGVLGVEMFLTSDGRVLVNELAPRPHNSGHYTLDCCVTSQFENHVRAVCSFPLGSVKPVVRSGVMINLLGDGFGSGFPQGLEAVLRHPQARVHLYGKTAKPGRKLGHLTVVGERSPVELRVEAQRLADNLKFKEPQAQW